MILEKSIYENVINMAFAQKTVFVQDNAPCYTVREVQNGDSHRIHKLYWPEKSLDMNIIENCGVCFIEMSLSDMRK